ncbi:hypothetical protein DM860_013802 [Cuscuta australis]|uniref:Uncharacterized protein n=1 Tax=Cuscuta australis TaxID=267555 RepID=A0A328DIX7_9ASTE|nr:hypothetical protein DM860_013802 [Cuscuta australis]
MSEQYLHGGDIEKGNGYDEQILLTHEMANKIENGDRGIAKAFQKASLAYLRAKHFVSIQNEKDHTTSRGPSEKGS